MLTSEVIKRDVTAVVTVQKGQVTLGECERGWRSHGKASGFTHWFDENMCPVAISFSVALHIWVQMLL